MGLRPGQPSKAFLEGKLQAKDLRSRSPEDRKRISQMGVAARKKKAEARKQMKEQLEMLLSMDVKKKAHKQRLEEMGIEEHMMTNQMLMLASLLSKSFTGDVQAIKQISDMVDGNIDGVQEEIDTKPIININVVPPNGVSVKSGAANVQSEDDSWDDDDWEYELTDEERAWLEE